MNSDTEHQKNREKTLQLVRGGAIIVQGAGVTAIAALTSSLWRFLAIPVLLAIIISNSAAYLQGYQEAISDSRKK